MIKEYFVVARYVASVPEDCVAEEFILDRFCEDIRTLSLEQMKKYAFNNFSVIEGDEMDLEDLENEND